MKKKTQSVAPKFFCENCNNEVKRNTRVCSYCGRFFASVECPNCKFIGSSDEFIGGCPNCGYAVKSNTKKIKSKKQKVDKNTDDSLPFWIYIIVSILILAFIIFASKIP